MTSEHARVAPRVPSVVPLLNPLVRRFIGAGVPFGPNVLLTVRGRASGRPRTFPVAILPVEGRRYVQSPFGEVNWVRNLRASGEAAITRGHDCEEVDAVELAPESAAEILRATQLAYSRSRLGRVLARLFLHLRPDAGLEEYLSEARGHPMFELVARGQPAEGAATGGGGGC